MDFTLPEEHELLRQSARKFAEEEVVDYLNILLIRMISLKKRRILILNARASVSLVPDYKFFVVDLL